jgi:hypothetical protein
MSFTIRQKALFLIILQFVNIYRADNITTYMQRFNDIIPDMESVNGNDIVKIDVAIPDEDGLYGPYNKLPKNILWPDVIQYIKINEMAGDFENMRKVLSMRYIIIFSLLITVSYRLKSEIRNFNNPTISGNFNNFKLCYFKLSNISGVCFFFTSYETTKKASSTIDLLVDVNSQNGNFPILDRIRYVAELIESFNEMAFDFMAESPQTSFEINLNFNFDPTYLPEGINQLKKEKPLYFLYFAAHSRLGIAMAIYNDALSAYSKNSVFQKQGITVIKDLFDTSNGEEQYFIDIQGFGLNKKIELFLKKRPNDFHLLAKFMVHHAIYVGKSESELDLLCHINAATFYAPEGYIGLGAFYYFKKFSSGEKITITDENETDNTNDFQIKIYKNFVLEYLLNNFALAVQSYFQYGTTTRGFQTGDIKFWKYTARMVEALKHITSPEIQLCWTRLFDNHFFILNPIPKLTTAAEVIDLAVQMSGEFTVGEIVGFIKDAYSKCMEQTVLLVYTSSDTKKIIYNLRGVTP